jgi:hypothetical protein
VHVAAVPGASDLPLTGTFPDMLGRLARLGLPREAAATAAGPWAPERLLDGFGRWREAEPGDAVAPRLDAGAAPSRAPGVYAAGAVRGALNVLPTDAVLSPLAGASRATVAEAAPRPLGGWLLLAALVLLAVDLAVAQRLLRPAAVAAACVLLFAPGLVRAQGAAGLAAETRLAYVVTGDSAVDRLSRSGLEALTAALRERTAAAPGAPVAVDPGRDSLALYPALYWPVTAGAALSPEGASRLAAYLRGGGVILFDTRDDGAPSAAVREALRRVMGALDPPPLRVVG